VTAAALLDTSVFVAVETGRSLVLDALPDRGHLSAITYAELQAGVLAATDLRTRSDRLATVEFAASYELLPVDAAAARHWARLRIELRDAGRAMKVNDLWIASVALAHDLPVVTQDHDFDVLADLGLLEVIPA
jgi:predicted nucleic acid-binding protein